MSHSNFKAAKLTLAIQATLLTMLSAHATNTDSPVDNTLPSTTLAPIYITASSENGEGSVDGIAPSTVASLGYNESILEATQSVSVIGEQQIEGIGADTLNSALTYTTGITTTDTKDKTFSSNNIRGFRNRIINRDGQKYQANIFDGQQELYGFERIEVLKGASSVLNGEVAPGGMVNAVTKKPLFTNDGEINIEGGSFNHKKLSFDVNKEISDNLAVRLVGVYQDSDTFIDKMDDDITYIAPSLTWNATDNTKITLLADYQDTKTKYSWALPLKGTLLDSKHGKIDRETYLGNPKYDSYENQRHTIGYEVTHDVSPNFKVAHSLRKMNTDLDFTESRINTFAPNNGRIFPLAAFKRFESSDVLNANINVKYDWSVGDKIDNSTVLGIDYYDGYHDTERYVNPFVGTIDIFDPDYSKNDINSNNVKLPASAVLKNPFASWIDDKQDLGVYLQNKLTYNDKLIGNIGLRNSSLDVEKTAFFDRNKKQSADYSVTTGSFGLAYLMDNGLAPYGSYSQSFEAELGQDRAGNKFDPTEGEQYEVGVRYQPQNSDTLLTASVYRIDQTNVLVKDPVDVNYKTQLGKVRSEGLELEAQTKIGDHANLVAGYSYIDARNLEASPLYPNDEGRRLGNIPKNTFSLWGDYRFEKFGMPQLTTGLGVRYTGETEVTIDQNKASEKTYTVPDYTLVDMMVGYDVSDDIKLSLNVRNLLDEEYNNCSSDGCSYGESRNVVGKIAYNW